MAKILLVDDDDQIRELLRQMIVREGYKVVDAPDGKIGMRSLREVPADLVILYLLMPGKDGLEAIIELRHDFLDVKIIAISGEVSIGADDYLNMVKALGAQSTLYKPFSMKELLKSVQELIGNDKAH
jgi:DNA-binding response OmpR family regulator